MSLLLALFGHAAMSDLSPLCAQKRTSASRAAMLKTPNLLKEILSRVGVPGGLSIKVAREGLSGRGFESLEAQREPLPIREILGATWQMYGAAIEPL
jgi:hypothetical protein